MLYCGGGIITGNAARRIAPICRGHRHPGHHHASWAAARFLKRIRCPCAGWACTAAASANWAVSGEFKQRKSPDEPLVKIKPGADLLLAFGVRFDDRVTGKVDEFCKTGTIVHIDIDQSEHNKNRKVHLAIESDIKYALGRLNEMVRKRPMPKKFPAWHGQIDEWKQARPVPLRGDGGSHAAPSTCATTCKGANPK